MTFEEYSRIWLEKQNLVKSTRKTTRQILENYCFTVIGSMNISDVEEADIDSIFICERLFNRGRDFTERTYRVLDKIFEESIVDGLIINNPVTHIYNAFILSHEKLIFVGKDVVLTCSSPFVDVACIWLKNQGYSSVTYNLYLHFLDAFVFPFIGSKPIGLVDQNGIRNIYRYFNTVNTNETWISQIHLVMRMVFDFATKRGLIVSNPLFKVNDPHLDPIIELDRSEKNAVRHAFNRYGFRKNHLKELSRELFIILHKDEEYRNAFNIRKNPITVNQVYEQWYRNTQEEILSKATSKSSYHSMNIYVLQNIGNKAVQKVSLKDLVTILKVFLLMGNTSDFYIIARLRSFYDYAKNKQYVSDNIANCLRSKNIRAPEKQVLSDSEIMRFFKICDDSDSVYGCLLGMTLCTGLRIREAMAVSWSNVNRDLKTLKIQSQVSNGVLIPTTKTRRERKISLSRAAISFMEKASRYSVNGNSNGLIFTAEKGSPLSYTNVTRKLNEIALEMGRPDITAHTLRHTYMTVSSRCGENLNEIQNEVGHGYSSDVITEYLHQTEESIIESANRRQEYLVKLINDNGGLNGLFL